MIIPAELKPLIARVRQQHPRLEDTPDEAAPSWIVWARAAQSARAWRRS